MMKNVVKKNQKIPFLFMLMLLACMSASAQFQVKGTVVSANDSEPMIGVTILENVPTTVVLPTSMVIILYQLKVVMLPLKYLL